MHVIEHRSEEVWAHALGSCFSGTIITIRIILYMLIEVTARKQPTMLYHVHVTLLCTQCLYDGIHSSTLSLPFVIDCLLIKDLRVIAANVITGVEYQSKLIEQGIDYLGGGV